MNKLEIEINRITKCTNLNASYYDSYYGLPIQARNPDADIYCYRNVNNVLIKYKINNETGQDLLKSVNEN